MNAFTGTTMPHGFMDVWMCACVGVVVCLCVYMRVCVCVCLSVCVCDILASLQHRSRRFTEVIMHFLVTKCEKPLPCHIWYVPMAMSLCVCVCVCVCVFPSSVWYILNSHYTFIAPRAFPATVWSIWLVIISNLQWDLLAKCTCHI